MVEVAERLKDGPECLYQRQRFMIYYDPPSL